MLSVAFVSMRMEQQGSIPGASHDTTFHAFPSFQPELRHLIWKFTLPGPRLVPIHSRRCTPGTVPPEIVPKRGMHTLISHAPLPITLSINRESRATALLFYRLLFQTSHPHPVPGQIYFNPDIDILYFPSSSSTRQELIFERSRVTSPLGEDLASFYNFLAVVHIVSSQDALLVKKLAIHEDLFRESPFFIWNDPRLQADRFKLVWKAMVDKFQNVTELTIGGGEEDCLGEFWEEDVLMEDVEEETLMVESGDEKEDSSDNGDDDKRSKVSDATSTEALEEGSGPDMTIVREETLHDIALQTFWEFRSMHPDWIELRWRVFKREAVRRFGWDRRAAG
jgi:hypothetical protein